MVLLVLTVVAAVWVLSRSRTKPAAVAARVAGAPSASPAPHAPRPAAVPVTAHAATPAPTVAAASAGTAALDPAPVFDRAAPVFGVAWRKVADLPEPRAKSGAAVLGGLIYLVGGESRDGILKSVVTYDPATSTWGATAPLNGPREDHGVVVVSGRLYALGGFDGTNLLGSVEIWDPAKRSWTVVPGAAASMPTPRSGFACVAAGNLIYAFGGDRPAVEVFDARTGRWTRKANLPWRLTGGVAVAWKDRIYLVGGSQGQVADGAVHVYDPSADAWLADAQPIQVPRAGLAVVRDGTGAAFAIGGVRGTALDTVEVCRAPGEKWWALGSLGAPRMHHQAVLVNGRIYVIGGSDNSPVTTVYEGTIVPER